MKIKFSYLEEEFKNNKLYIANWKKLIKSTDFTLGFFVEKFEKEFARFIGSKYCISTNNGTDALILSLKSLGVKKGDEVITVCNSFYASAGAIVACGAKPILVDCDSRYQIDIEKIKKKITKKTKAIIITHIYSYSNDMDKIIKICKKNKIFLIEDAAEVLGLKYKNNYCGSFGDISTFSFYANKQLTTGEGGMISTNNPKVYKKCKSLRNLCFGNKQRFNHEDIGWNYRLTNIQAALGISQLKRLDKVVKRKMYIGNESIKIAIVDNAIATNHADLNVFKQRDVADDDNDTTPPEYFLSDQQGQSWSHGTHCAGLATAQINNSIGITSHFFTIIVLSFNEVII